jgi:hypothetical protein
VAFWLSLSSFSISPFVGGKRGRYVERMSRRSINTRTPVFLPIHRKRSMYLTCLNPDRGSFNTWMVSFIILSYHIFLRLLTIDLHILLTSGSWGPFPTAKAPCQFLVGPVNPNRNICLLFARLWNHLKNCAVVPLLNIGWTCTVGLSIFLHSESSNSLTEGGLPSDGSASFSYSRTYGIGTNKSVTLWLYFPIVGTWFGQMPS